MEKKEIYGDDLVRLLDAQNFQRPEIDWTDDATWPKLMNWSKIEPDDRSLNGRAPKPRPTRVGAVAAKTKARSPRKKQP